MSCEELISSAKNYRVNPRNEYQNSKYSYYSYDSEKSSDSNQAFQSMYFNGKSVRESSSDDVYQPITTNTVRVLVLPSLINFL